MYKVIQWSDDWDVHVEEINKQHKYLIDIINRIHSAINEGRINRELEMFLEDVLKYAIFHFRTEERYFDLFQYEFSGKHKEEHENMRKKIANFHIQYLEKGVEIIGEFTEFLEDWLIEHIGTHDKQYTRCFNKHGLL